MQSLSQSGAGTSARVADCLGNRQGVRPHALRYWALRYRPSHRRPARARPAARELLAGLSKLWPERLWQPGRTGRHGFGARTDALRRHPRRCAAVRKLVAGSFGSFGVGCMRRKLALGKFEEGGESRLEPRFGGKRDLISVDHDLRAKTSYVIFQHTARKSRRRLTKSETPRNAKILPLCRKPHAARRCVAARERRASASLKDQRRVDPAKGKVICHKIIDLERARRPHNVI